MNRLNENETAVFNFVGFLKGSYFQVIFTVLWLVVWAKLTLKGGTDCFGKDLTI